MKIEKDKKWILIGKIIAYLSWIGSWIIFSIKLDFLTFLGMGFFGLGLSGILLFDFIPKIIKTELGENKE
jgi:hypothetical protein